MLSEKEELRYQALLGTFNIYVDDPVLREIAGDIVLQEKAPCAENKYGLSYLFEKVDGRKNFNRLPWSHNRLFNESSYGTLNGIFLYMLATQIQGIAVSASKIITLSDLFDEGDPMDCAQKVCCEVSIIQASFDFLDDVVPLVTKKGIDDMRKVTREVVREFSMEEYNKKMEIHF